MTLWRVVRVVVVVMTLSVLCEVWVVMLRTVVWSAPCEACLLPRVVDVMAKCVFLSAADTREGRGRKHVK